MDFDFAAIWAKAEPVMLLAAAYWGILAKALLASIRAAMNGQFEWRRLPEFLGTDMLIEGVGLLLLFLPGLLYKPIMAAFVVAAVPYCAVVWTQAFGHLFALRTPKG